MVDKDSSRDPGAPFWRAGGREVVPRATLAAAGLASIRHWARRQRGFVADRPFQPVAGVAAADPDLLRVRLANQLGLRPEQIRLEIRDSVAVLRGTVDWPAQLLAAEALLRTHAELLDVVSFLRLSGSTELSPAR
jgi:hypothetical protein